MKKTTKSLDKEREKLSDLEAAPGRHQKEIQEMEKKLKILEVSSVRKTVWTGSNFRASISSS